MHVACDELRKSGGWWRWVVVLVLPLATCVLGDGCTAKMVMSRESAALVLGVAAEEGRGPDDFRFREEQP